MRYFIAVLILFSLCRCGFKGPPLPPETEPEEPQSVTAPAAENPSDISTKPVKGRR